MQDGFLMCRMEYLFVQILELYYFNIAIREPGNNLQIYTKELILWQIIRYLLQMAYECTYGT